MCCAHEGGHASLVLVVGVGEGKEGFDGVDAGVFCGDLKRGHVVGGMGLAGVGAESDEG